MSARKNQPAKWVLPATVNPPERICFQISVPKERAHIAAFRGALLDLASAYKWADDEEHTAKAVAAVWRQVIDSVKLCYPQNADGCCPQDEDIFMPMRQEGCLLQSQCADGSWMTIYDPTDCIKDLIGDNVGQQPADGDIAPGGFFEVCDIILQGSGRYIFPKKVVPGDTVTISQVRGGTYGRPGQVHWFCPSGDDYVFGGCVVSGDAPAGAGFPAPDLLAMRLIAHYGVDYYDAYNTSFVIPDSALQSDLQFQVNDIDLSDNAGSITFCVSVLHPAPTAEDFSGMDWVIPFDLAATDYSGLFTIATANGNDPKGYVVGEGISCGLSGNEVAFDLRLHIVAGYGEVRAVVAEIWNTYDSSTGDDGLYVQTNDDIHSTGGETLKQFSAGVWTTLRVDFASSEVEINPGYDTFVRWEVQGAGTPGAPPYGNTIVRKVWLAGIGTAPGPVHS